MSGSWGPSMSREAPSFFFVRVVAAAAAVVAS